jgi:hypothetical protein
LAFLLSGFVYEHVKQRGSSIFYESGENIRILVQKSFSQFGLGGGHGIESPYSWSGSLGITIAKAKIIS